MYDLSNQSHHLINRLFGLLEILKKNYNWNDIILNSRSDILVFYLTQVRTTF